MKQARRTAGRSRAAVHRRRLGVLAALGLLGYAGVLARAVQLQALDAGGLRGRATNQQSARMLLGPLRGEIRDRSGRLLAASADVESVAASPRSLDDPARSTHQLARALHTSPRALAGRLVPDRSFSWIKRWVTPEEADRVRELELAGVHLHPERKRFYPHRQLAGAYLGFAGRDGEGLAGLELAFDAALQGSHFELAARRDGRGRAVLFSGPARPRSGATLYLTLDARLQARAEAALENARRTTQSRHATLVALDPRNGDLLALVHSPGFDPNRFWRQAPPLSRARGFVDAFEPGSTFKPFSVAAALDAGVVRADEHFDCENGSWRLRDRTIRDWQPHGVLSVRDIIRLSSNIGAAKISDRLGSARLREGLARFGFGQSTASGFPGEVGGVLRKIRETQDVERANLAFGQGVSVTAVQLAVAASSLANGGIPVEPRLALQLETEDETLRVPVRRRPRAVSERTASQMLDMMREVVSHGTGKAAALPGVEVAGKTGTAQKVVHGRYSSDRFVASFIGIVPADDPRLVVVVILDEPRGAHSGGAVAAPVFAEIAAFAIAQIVPGDAV